MYSCEQTSTTATCMCVYRQVELTQYNYNELLMICKTSRVICIFSQFDQLDTHSLSFARICYEQRLLPSRSDTHSFSFSMFSNTKKCRGKKNAYGETSENIEWLHISLNELIKKYPRTSSYHCTNRPSRHTLCYPGAGHTALFRCGTTSCKVIIKPAATRGLWIQSWILRISPSSSAYMYEWERKIYSIGSK